MGLAKIKKINNSSLWALWKIEPGEPLDIPEKDREDPEMEQLHHPKKRAEWAAGRKALKTCLKTWDLPYNGAWKDHCGKPYLRKYPFFISIANCYPYAAAILHLEKPVGIDIEFPKPKLSLIKEKFLTLKEQSYAGENPLELSYYWCAKECLYKIQGKKRVSFKENLQIDPINFESGKGNIKGAIQTEHLSGVYQMSGLLFDGQKNGCVKGDFYEKLDDAMPPPLTIVYSL